MPVASGSFCNSTFYSRTREPFEPPPSAVIVSSCARVTVAAHALQPLADRLDRNLCRVARNADIHPTGIGRYVVDAIRHHLAERLVLEVVHLDAFWAAFRAIVGAAVLIIADQFLLL